MTTNHLLSTSLFTELFQHNIVSADGRIIANSKQLENYYTFLVQRSKEKTACLYEERKNMVVAVQKLLKIDDRTVKQTKLLKRLLNELDLKYGEDGLLSLKSPKKSRRTYVGPSEPRMSLFEREIDEEIKRAQIQYLQSKLWAVLRNFEDGAHLDIKILKHDLRILDEWMEQISGISCHILPKADRSSDWKELGIKFRERTRIRMCDMENARTKLIRQYYTDYDQMLQDVLIPKVFLKGTDRKKSASQKIERVNVTENVPDANLERQPSGISQVRTDSGTNKNDDK